MQGWLTTASPPPLRLHRRCRVHWSRCSTRCSPSASPPPTRSPPSRPRSPHRSGRGAGTCLRIYDAAPHHRRTALQTTIDPADALPAPGAPPHTASAPTAMLAAPRVRALTPPSTSSEAREGCVDAAVRRGQVRRRCESTRRSESHASRPRRLPQRNERGGLLRSRSLSRPPQARRPRCARRRCSACTRWPARRPRRRTGTGRRSWRTAHPRRYSEAKVANRNG